MVEPIAALRRIPIRESGEPMLHLPPTGAKLVVMAKYPWLRARLIGMVQQAAALLPGELRLAVTTAYRPLQVQADLYDNYYAKLKADHPQWSHATLRRLTNRFFAPADVRGVPAGHCTGGAVDVKILLPSGEGLEMNSPQTKNFDASATYKAGLSPEARKNRAILIRAMTAAGFSNYPGEWWHWSYGDSGWAFRRGKPFAIYELVQLEVEPEDVPATPPRWAAGD